MLRTNLRLQAVCRVMALIEAERALEGPKGRGFYVPGRFIDLVHALHGAWRGSRAGTPEVSLPGRRDQPKAAHEGLGHGGTRGHELEAVMDHLHLGVRVHGEHVGQHGLYTLR